ncbi:polyprenyl synthetase family protein [Streptomyces sp. SDr-06]|uniref:polyprenyl synthetase family protein n=1 Tax=Streptomyces sp. SDr-06 TaxID=2267702 RepID=UPI000DEB997B|nr:polyprenyl synthetase family protein [Streptomyces sp. SDr-06]RCH66650.1 polyprenyl synthetase family protein [Streptomyces sp. SDr-06]
MRPAQAKDHPAAAPSPLPRLVTPTGSPPEWVADGTPHAPTADDVTFGSAGSTAVDADVPAAVGHMLERVLADRLTRASVLDVMFGRELAERVAQFTLEGGKRTRSQLVWWAMRACGGGDESTAAALRIGAALELLQTCALVHDDVMDGADLRRGRPTLHTAVRDRHGSAASLVRAARFGEATAILAGDLALAWADDVMAEMVLPPATATVVRGLWSDMRTEMVAGQFLDLQGQLTRSRSLAQALRAARLKSALYSVERPLALGAAVAGADDHTTRALCEAGRCVGVAFQLRDDLDDVFGDPRRTGKSCGGDIRGGKPTCLGALAVARARGTGDRRALAVLERALGDEGLTPAGLDEVRDILERTGARLAVEAKIDQLLAQGLRYFEGARLDTDAKARLRGLLTAATTSRTENGPPLPSPPPAPDPAHAGSATPGLRR